MRRRIHLLAGNSLVIEKSDSQYSFLNVTGYHVDTDGSNDATLVIKGKNNDFLTAPGGHVVIGSLEAGGIANIHPESGKLEYPVTLTLSGTGSTATVFCFESN